MKYNGGEEITLPRIFHTISELGPADDLRTWTQEGEGKKNSMLH
jgi:hypothetical protein